MLYLFFYHYRVWTECASVQNNHKALWWFEKWFLLILKIYYFAFISLNRRTFRISILVFASGKGTLIIFGKKCQNYTNVIIVLTPTQHFLIGTFLLAVILLSKLHRRVCRLIANKDQKTLLYQTVWIICRPNIPWSFSAGNKPAPHLREMVMFSHPPYAKCLPDSVCQNVQPPAAKIPPPLNPIDGTGYQVSSIVCPPHHPTLLPPSHSSQHRSCFHNHWEGP